MPGTWIYQMVIQALQLFAYFSLPLTFALVFLASPYLFFLIQHISILKNYLKTKKYASLLFLGPHLVTTVTFIPPSK